MQKRAMFNVMSLDVIVLSVLAAMVLTALPFQVRVSAESEKPQTRNGKPVKVNETEKTGNVAVYFEENRGQFNERASYLARGTNGHTLYLAPADAIYVVSENRQSKDEARLSKNKGPDPKLDDPIAAMETGTPRRAVAVFMSLVGGNRSANSVGMQQLEHRTNYFKGRQENWRTEIPNYAQVRFDGVYPGIDVVWHGNAAGGAVAGMTVEPFADVSQIEWEIAGADDVRVSRAGDLLIRTEFGDIVQPAPKAFQIGDGLRTDVEIDFEVSEAASGRFRVGYRVGEFDRGRAFEIGSAPKGIPPTGELSSLGFSTYVGAGNDENGEEIFVDSSNNVYVAGFTNSESNSDPFPTVPGSFDTAGNAWDGFVFKMNSTGSGLIYSTYLGGNNLDTITDMKVDAAGNVYVTGRTNSSDYPFLSGFDPTFNGGTWDAFVTKLNPSGSALVFSSYIGGSSDDRGWGIAIDGSNNVYVSGYTASSDFPVTGSAFDTTANGGFDAFLTRFSSSGASLAYSTYFGGAGADDGNVRLAVDPAGNAYIAGASTSIPPIFPVTTGAFQTSNAGWYDIYAAKIDTTVSGSAGLIYSTFIGGSGMDNIGKIRVNAAGELHLTGYTESSSFPTTPGAYDTTHNGGEDAIVVKLNSNATGLLYSTFLGSNWNQRSFGLFITPTGEVFVTGYTLPSAFPTTPGAYDSTANGDSDAFVAKVDVTGTLTGSASLMYSSYLGSSGADEGYGIFSTASDVAYVTGYSRANDFPTTPGVFDPTHNGANDVFVTKLAPPPPTAAGVEVSGRVMTPDGRGLRNATVTMTDGQGVTRSAVTSSFGYYRFEGVPVGDSFVMTVNSRNYRFTPRVVLVLDTLTDVDFVGLE